MVCFQFSIELYACCQILFFDNNKIKHAFMFYLCFVFK